MKKRITIDELAIGMFVETQVHSERAAGQMRHFLVPVGADYGTATSKRARLTRRKHKQVAHARGLLLSSASHVDALKSTGLSVVTINTDKGADVPRGAHPVEVLDEEHITDARRSAAILLGTEQPDEPGESASDDDCFLDVVDEAPVSPDAAPPSRRGAVSAPPRTRNTGDTRIQFGPSGKGWMKVEASPGGEQAVLKVLSFGGDKSLGLDDVLHALKQQYGLRFGFDEILPSARCRGVEIADPCHPW